MKNKATKEQTRYLTPNECKLINSFPGLTETELEEVNDSFPHYVFIKNCGDGWEVSTSCCHVDRRFYAYLREIETPEEDKLLRSRHNEDGVCPYCGRPVTFKHTGKCGKFRKLGERRCVAFWKAKGDKVFIQCYWANKEYGLGYYTGNVGYIFDNAYVFMPGAAYQFDMEYCAYYCRMEKLNIVKRISILEPFWYSWSIMSGREREYIDVGREQAIEKSFLKYSQLEAFEKESRWCKHNSPMKYMTLYSLYPRAIEMLMKNGMQQAVRDYIYYGKKNAASIKWDETDPRKAFGLNGQELKAFMALPNRDVEYIECYKYCRKQGWKESWEDISYTYGELRGDDLPMRFYRACRKYKLTPTRLRNYLNKFNGRRAPGGFYRTPECAWQTWSDYLYAAGEIGYDIKNPVVLLPKNLNAAHDAATGEHRRRLEAARVAAEKKRRLEQYEEDWNLWFCEVLRQAKLKKQCAEELEKRDRRYAYADGNYFIRPAKDGDEVIAEGKALEHCVGGYATRHMEGKLTICFMRRVTEPDKPFLTIEMRGGKLQQIHGYKNEFDGAPDPRKEYKAFLDPWILWVADGSPRDKNGNPVTKKRKTKKNKEVKAA